METSREPPLLPPLFLQIRTNLAQWAQWWPQSLLRKIPGFWVRIEIHPALILSILFHMFFEASKLAPQPPYVPYYQLYWALSSPNVVLELDLALAAPWTLPRFDLTTSYNAPLLCNWHLRYAECGLEQSTATRASLPTHQSPLPQIPKTRQIVETDYLSLLFLQAGLCQRALHLVERLEKRIPLLAGLWLRFDLPS